MAYLCRLVTPPEEVTEETAVETTVETETETEVTEAEPDVKDLQAKVQSHVARLAQAEATVSAQAKEIKTLRALIDGLEASKGLSAASVVAETLPSDPTKGTILEQYESMKDVTERRKFFSANKDAILAANKAKN
jgi:hypothetical protein